VANSVPLPPLRVLRRVLDNRMLKSLFSKPLKLALKDRTVSFASLVDFDFSLASRTEVPAVKIADLVRLSSDALTKEATNIRQVEHRFVDMLSKSMEETGSIGVLLRNTDSKLFSQDHEWRTIFQALNKAGKDYDEYKQLALGKYMQYLGSRQDVLKSIFANKFQLDETANSAPQAAGPDLRETIIFESQKTELLAPRDDELQRLPRGETVTVSLGDEENVEIVLSRHKFTIVSGQQLYLVDENGPDYVLRNGRNYVGRQQDNNVIVDAGYRDVSRKHLIIDIEGGQDIRLTDLSSHGTYVSALHLGGHFGGKGMPSRV
jgi:hypothetical protein